VSVAPAGLDGDWVHLRQQVRGMLGGRLASGADTEDVVQDVLLRVFRNTSSLRDGDRFGSWLATMVRNAVADQLRAKQRHPVVAREQTEEADPALPQDESDENARRCLIAALRPFAERLPAIYRDVITMSELEDVSQAEIARRLSISVSGVKSRVQRGREQLRQMLNDCCEISLDARRGIVDCVPKQPGTADCCPPSTAAAGAEDGIVAAAKRAAPSH
jgi:RNA polymerase sigma-70 factor, ECF subfamily